MSTIPSSIKDQGGGAGWSKREARKAHGTVDGRILCYCCSDKTRYLVVRLARRIIFSYEVQVRGNRTGQEYEHDSSVPTIV